MWKMMQMAMAAQSDGFQARIDWINNPRNVSYFDPELNMHVPRRVSKEFINRKRVKRLGFARVGVSVVIGCLAYIAVQVMLGWLGLVPPSELTLFGVATILAVVLGTLVRHKTMFLIGAQVAGIALMITSAHNAVWMFPDAVSLVTSTAYVTQVQATTTPNSIMLLGEIYTL